MAWSTSSLRTRAMTPIAASAVALSSSYARVAVVGLLDRRRYGGGRRRRRRVGVSTRSTELLATSLAADCGRRQCDERNRHPQILAGSPQEWRSDPPRVRSQGSSETGGSR